MQASTSKGTVALTSSTREDLRSGGGAYERVHPYTRDIIHTLFPSHTCGGTFYLGLLASAAVKPCASPCKPQEMNEVAAVVTVAQGCDELSRLVHLSYDTTQMYLMIYRTLGLLREEKRGKLTMIVIPFVACQSPDELLGRLRQLRERYCEKRQRMHNLIDNAIKRLVAIVQVDQGQPPLAQQEHPRLPSSPQHADLLTYIQRGLIRQGVEDPDGQIAICVADELVQSGLISDGGSLQHTSVGRFVPKNLPAPQKEGIRGQDSAKPESTSQVGSSLGRFDSENLPLPRQSANEGIHSCRSTPTALPTDTEPQGRFLETNLPKPVRESANGVDLLRTNVTIDQYSQYFIRMMTNVTLREQLQRFLATVLEDEEKQWPRYNPLFAELTRDTLSAPEAITAALVETLVIRHTYHSLAKPGGYFTKCCRAYCTQIPAHVRDLVQTYGHMTYEELVADLESKADQSVSQPSSRRKRTHLGRAYALNRPSAQNVVGCGKERGLAVEQKRLSEDEAKALEVQIKREAPFVEVRGIRRVHQTAYELDVSIDGVPWTIASKGEWDRYYADLRTCESYSYQVREAQANEQMYSYPIQT